MQDLTSRRATLGLISQGDPSAEAQKAKHQMIAAPATSAAVHSPVQESSRHPQTRHPHPTLSYHRTEVLACLQPTSQTCLSPPSQSSLLLPPSYQACWNLSFKWMPSMAAIDKRRAFDCSCIAEKEEIHPGFDLAGTPQAPLLLQWDALACSYSFKLPASTFPFKEDEFFRLPLLRN